jgi:predicted DNA-binding transcriptional regulator YafY
MRASRLLSMLLLLPSRGHMTAPELAGALDVSVRTVYRDVEALSLAGVPVYADRGPAGGYQLLDGYKTRLTGLSSDEAESLFLAGLPGPAAELGLGAVLATAQLKLLAALPLELRARAGRIRERFHLDAPGWFQDTEQTPYLEEIAAAVWNQNRVRVRYQRWTGEVTRTLEPLGLVLKSGIWYLVARAIGADEVDHDNAGQIRMYRISRIEELVALHDHFERPGGFDLGEYWQVASQRFESNLYRIQAVVRLAPRGLDRLPSVLGSVVMQRVRENIGEPESDGWVQVALPIESIEDAEEILLRLGAYAEALAPSELRERMVKVSHAVARLYDPR